jgi:ribosomal protein S11
LKSKGSEKDGIVTITDKKGKVIFGTYKQGDLEFDFQVDTEYSNAISKYNFKSLPKTITTSI